ncbi:MAG: 16S rRNA (cytosine(1402)-N(4))-methyltransferase RsmH [bacterium]|nr:16S rRNA (cytosine(1402)-N(4))-methyltransferase RsmH [bacterium]
MTQHVPVLLNEVINYLDPRPGRWYIDATFGGGGYSLAILQRKANLIAFDLDQQAITLGKKRLASACPPGASYHLFHLNYKNMDQALHQLSLNTVDGVVFDLGFSTDQLHAGRGFSFQHPDDLLDLRYDKFSGRPAWQLLSQLTPAEIADALILYSQHPQAQAIAQEIHQIAVKRQLTMQDIIDIAKKHPAKKTKTHPATTILQALRILVNKELDNLKTGLLKAVSHLKPGGRLVVVSFHSGEDRIVKNFLKTNPHLKTLTKKAVTPSLQEIKHNPKSRSAKLRAAEKI